MRYFRDYFINCKGLWSNYNIFFLISKIISQSLVLSAPHFEAFVQFTICFEAHLLFEYSPNESQYIKSFYVTIFVHEHDTENFCKRLAKFWDSLDTCTTQPTLCRKLDR